MRQGCIQIADGGDAQGLCDGGGGDAKAGGLIGAGGDLHLGARERAFGGEAGQRGFPAQRVLQGLDGGVEIGVIAGQDRIGNIAVATVVQLGGADVGDEGELFKDLHLDLVLRAGPARVFKCGHH